MRSCALAALVALALAGPACAAMSDGVVRIGVLTDMGGPYSDNVGAGAVLAARMAVEDFGGTVAGVPVEVVSADHQNKTDIGSAIARRWYDVDKVDAITEVVSSAVALSVQQISRDKDRIFLATGPGTRISPARPARPSACTGPTTTTRSVTWWLAPWCGAA